MNIRNIAIANIKGGGKYPDIRGSVTFSPVQKGVLVTVEIYGLPEQNSCCRCGVFGFHIHDGSTCTGDVKDEFANAGSHFNPTGCMHPYHAGDMPPLFSDNGYAYMQFITNRFTIADVADRAVIIHSKPDDFTTQPSGNSGEKIACGIIEV